MRRRQIILTPMRNLARTPSRNLNSPAKSVTSQLRATKRVYYAKNAVIGIVLNALEWTITSTVRWRLRMLMVLLWLWPAKFLRFVLRRVTLIGAHWGYFREWCMCGSNITGTLEGQNKYPKCLLLNARSLRNRILDFQELLLSDSWQCGCYGNLAR